MFNADPDRAFYLCGSGSREPNQSGSGYLSDLIFPVVLRIRIDFNVDPDPAFFTSMRIRIQGSQTNPDPDLWSEFAGTKS
jgi:hypothetical protein